MLFSNQDLKKLIIPLIIEQILVILVGFSDTVMVASVGEAAVSAAVSYTHLRLERQMDTLDINDSYFDRKILDLQRRYDEQYGRIEEVETQIEEVKSQIQSIRREKISGDNIYQLLLAFNEVYGAATEIEQKAVSYTHLDVYKRQVVW